MIGQQSYKNTPPQKKRNPGYLHEYQTLKDISLRHWLAMTCLENNNVLFTNLSTKVKIFFPRFPTCLHRVVL